MAKGNHAGLDLDAVTHLLSHAMSDTAQPLYAEILFGALEQRLLPFSRKSAFSDHNDGEAAPLFAAMSDGGAQFFNRIGDLGD